jgi:hypothetical protein
MGIILLKFLIALAAGLIGGFVHHNLGPQWGIPMLAGVGLGFWVSRFLE